MPSTISNKVETLDLRGKLAVVSGGTQGIGAACALRLAWLGASVIVVGRHEAFARTVLGEMGAVQRTDAQQFHWVHADLARVSGMKGAAEDISILAGKHGGKVDLLIETQGMLPNGKWVSISEDEGAHDRHFGVQVLSRFALPHLLSKSAVLKEDACVVIAFAPCQEKREANTDVDDLELRKVKAAGKYSILRVMQRDSWALDCITFELARRHPGLRTHHYFPPFTHTNLFENSSCIPALTWFIQFTIRFLPFIGNRPSKVAERIVWLATGGEGEGRMFVDSKLKPLKPPRWVEEDEGKRNRVWEKLASMLRE